MPTTFFTAAGQPAFTTETRTGDYTVEYPLGAAEPTALLIKAPYMQTRADYARPAANTTLSYGSATAYFIDDVDFKDERGGVCTWTRLWATVPASYMEPGGTLAYTFPAYTAPFAFGTLYSVTGITASGANYVLNSNATGVSAGEQVYLDINYLRSNQNYHVTTLTPALAATAGVSVTIGGVLPGVSTFSGVSGSLQEGSIGRVLPVSLEVDSWVLHQFALSSESDLDANLPQIDKFSPVNSSGFEVDTLSTGTATTPNSSTYSSMVAAGNLIVARRSDRRRYLGNIYERQTILVKAR